MYKFQDRLRPSTHQLSTFTRQYPKSEKSRNRYTVLRITVKTLTFPPNHLNMPMVVWSSSGYVKTIKSHRLELRFINRQTEAPANRSVFQEGYQQQLKHFLLSPPHQPLLVRQRAARRIPITVPVPTRQAALVTARTTRLRSLWN